MGNAGLNAPHLSPQATAPHRAIAGLLRVTDSLRLKRCLQPVIKLPRLRHRFHGQLATGICQKGAKRLQRHLLCLAQTAHVKSDARVEPALETGNEVGKQSVGKHFGAAN